MYPSPGGMMAAPASAITITAPPSLVLGPKSFTPVAKIVGYIIDMKKLVATSAHQPAMPGCRMPTSISAMLISAYTPIISVGRNQRISQVEMMRPRLSAIRCPVRNSAAVRSPTPGVLLHIEDAGAPGADLRADIEELRHHRQPKM